MNKSRLFLFASHSYSMRARIQPCAPLLLLLASSRAFDDAVTSLPTYGQLRGKQYAGFAPVTPDGSNKLHCVCASLDPGTTSRCHR